MWLLPLDKAQVPGRIENTKNKPFTAIDTKRQDMVGKQGVSRLLGLGRLPAGLVLLASAGLLATGCGGKTGCGSGAESGEDAVRQFLSAAARDDSDDDVCRYLQEGESVDEAVTWVSGLGAAGDVDALEVREVRGDQMGAAHRFVLGPSSAPVADLAVIESGGRFVVSVTGSTKK